MLDIIILDTLYDQYKKRTQQNFTVEGFSTSTSSLKNWIYFIVFNLLAAYLSWSCNTNLKDSIIFRIIFTLNAFSLGFIYLIFYFFSNYLGKGCGCYS